MDEALQGELLELLERINLDDDEVEFKLNGRTVTIAQRATRRTVAGERFEVRYLSISLVEPTLAEGVMGTPIND